MKKKKLLVLLPLMAISLSSCGYTITPEDAPEKQDDEPLGEYTPSEETEGDEPSSDATYSVRITNGSQISSLKEGDSVLVSVSLITTVDGVSESVEGTASEVTITSLDTSIISVEGLRITALKEGYTSIYATWTEHATISSPMTVYVGQASSVPEPEPDVIDYSVEITNFSELSSLTVEDSKTVSVSLITTTNGVPSSIPGSSETVTLSSSDSSVVSISGLTITALSKGTSNITATWIDQNKTSNSVTVSVSEKTEAPTPDPEPTPDPVITYKVEITNASDIREIETGNQKLVEVTAYELSDGVETGTTYKGSSEDETLTLISSEPDYLSVDGLTITALAAKEAITLTAVWQGYGIATAPVTVTATPEPEPEPDVYTYEMSVNNQEDLQYLAVGYEYENGSSVTLDITLTTYINGEYAYSYKADNTVTDLELISWNSEIVTTSGLTVSAVSEGSTVVEVKWYDHPLNGGGEGFDDLSYFVNVTVTRFEEPEPEFVPISTLTFAQESYDFILGETGPLDLVVNVEPSNATNPDSYCLKVDNSSVAKINESGKLEAVGEGNTLVYAVATDVETADPVIGSATVNVEIAKNPVTSFGLSNINISLSIGDSATIGLAATDEQNNPTVVVDPYPADADDKTFTITSNTYDDYLSITGPSVDGLNTYTVTANEDAEDAGASIHSYVLTIASNDVNSSATRQVYVTIDTEESITNPVTRIGFSAPYITIANSGSFVLGGDDVEDADVTVSVNNDAYETGWNLVSYDESLLSVQAHFDTETGAFSFTLTALEPDNTYTISTDVVVRSMGSPVREAHLAVYILRAEDYTASINVNTSSVDMLTDQTVVLGEDDNDFSVDIYNQYGEVLEGASWSASIESSSSGIGVLSSVSKVDGYTDRLSITSGSNTGTGVIRISADEDESIYEEIKVNVSQQYYAPETLTFELGTITLNYNIESDPQGTSAYIQDGAITYWSSKGPVGDDYKGFTLEYSGDYLSIDNEGRTITALLPTGDDGVEVTAKSTYNDAFTTFTVVVNDLTDYAVKTLSLVNSEGNDVTSIELTVSADADSSTYTLSELGVYVNIAPTYATNQDYTITSSNPSLVYVDSENNITARASKDDGSVTLYVIANDNTYGASDSLTVNVSTSYVKASTISVNITETALTTGDTLDFDTQATVTVGSTSGSPTDITYTISSSNPDAVSVDGHKITAEGAGEATLTFTTVDGATTSVTITVTDPRTVGNNITLYFRLTDANGSTEYTCPDYADIYVGNNFADGSDSWTTARLTADTTTVGGSTYYKATFSSVLLDTSLDYQILFEYTEDEVTSPTWNHKSTTLTLTISSDVADGGDAFYNAAIGDPTEIIHERNHELEQFTVTVGLKNTSNSGSNVTFAIAGTALNEWSGGQKFTAVSGNQSYDQYYTFNWDRDADMRFFFGRYDVWWAWNIIIPGSYSPTWGSDTAYCWYNEWSAPEWAFDLSSYAGELDNYTNLLIVFEFDFSKCTYDTDSFAIVSNMSVTLS